VKSLFPAFLKLDGRPVLVVGAGKVGQPKIEGLLATGASISVVALEVGQACQDWARTGAISLHQRAFCPADLDGVFLTVVATASRDLNELVFNEAQRRGVLCNVVDVPGQCDFFYPALVRRGDLQIAISTAGQSPSLAQRIRQQLERQFGPNYAQWVEELGETRRRVLASDLPPEQKRDLLQSLASREAFEAALVAQAEKRLRSSNSELGAIQENLPTQSPELVARSSEEGVGIV
jgi:precorrin-2 dehydrogenase / sirohydrochlorin ferrochelatase